MEEHIKEQTSVIDETVEILSEIAQEHAQDELDRKMKCSSSITTNGVRSVRLTWNRITLPLTIRMRMGISDFCICRTRSRTSRPGVHYDTYEEAAAALYEAEREMANMPFNKENNIGSYMVNGRAQLERIMEARQLQKHMDI